jgi:hypothetical protein
VISEHIISIHKQPDDSIDESTIELRGICSKLLRIALVVAPCASFCFLLVSIQRLVFQRLGSQILIQSSFHSSEVETVRCKKTTVTRLEPEPLQKPEDQKLSTRQLRDLGKEQNHSGMDG